MVKKIKKIKASGEPLVLILIQDDPPKDIEVDDPEGIPHTISNWTLSRASMATPQEDEDDDYVELIAPDQTIVDWPARAMPKGVPAGSKLRFEVSILSGPQRTTDTTVSFDKGKLGLGLDQVRSHYHRPPPPHASQKHVDKTRPHLFPPHSCIGIPLIRHAPFCLGCDSSRDPDIRNPVATYFASPSPWHHRYSSHIEIKYNTSNKNRRTPDGFCGAMISSVAEGGQAEKSGKVHVGDLLVEVNEQCGAAVSKSWRSSSQLAVTCLKLKPRPWITEIFD